MDLYCVIDIGSNTVRLVIYQLREGVLQPILINKVAAGLASYVDKQNRMTPDGVRKLVSILRDFQQILSLLPDCQVFLSPPLPCAISRIRIMSFRRLKTCAACGFGSSPVMRRPCWTTGALPGLWIAPAD